MFKTIIAILATFTVGFLVSSMFSNVTAHQTAQELYELPLSQPKQKDNVFAKTIFVPEPEPKAVPGDRVPEGSIGVYSDQVVMKISNPKWAKFTDTHSMDPVLSSKAHAIEIEPESPDDIQVGDIVSYVSEYADGTIIHRVVETGEDSKGWYAIMKGDNNPKEDPGKVRFEQIKRVVVAIIY
ncbi:hypothetical protein J4475_02885 [Candidatus Woesearchaeota archaeon]|nr:hypothetical protein [Candidatus Woesearchaeota archaeon]